METEGSGEADAVDAEKLDEIERAHRGHLQVENLNATIASFRGGKRCPHCGTRFMELEMYRQHIERTDRTGTCLGQPPPESPKSSEGDGEHRQHLYVVPEQRPHDAVEAIPREGASLRGALEADDRYRVVGYEEAMELASQPGWIVSPCWCRGDGFSKRAERHPNGAIGSKLGVDR